MKYVCVMYQVFRTCYFIVQRRKTLMLFHISIIFLQGFFISNFEYCCHTNNLRTIPYFNSNIFVFKYLTFQDFHLFITFKKCIAQQPFFAARLHQEQERITTPTDSSIWPSTTYLAVLGALLFGSVKNFRKDVGITYLI